MTDIYPAGEKPIPGVTAHTIIDTVKAKGDVAVRHTPDFETMTDELVAQLRPGDMVITMGAGDIFRAGELLLQKLKTSSEGNNG